MTIFWRKGVIAQKYPKGLSLGVKLHKTRTILLIFFFFQIFAAIYKILDDFDTIFFTVKAKNRTIIGCKVVKKEGRIQ